MVSVVSVGAPADPETGGWLLEAGSPELLACSDTASDSEDGFVHWRAFFYREPTAHNRAEAFKEWHFLLKHMLVSFNKTTSQTGGTITAAGRGRQKYGLKNKPQAISPCTKTTSQGFKMTEP